jgi:hypothetical protein
MNASLQRSFRRGAVMCVVAATAVCQGALLSAHTVYGVPARPPVVVAPAPHPVVVAPRPVVVAPAPAVVVAPHPAVVVAPAPVVAMPAGYIAVLPVGYTTVTVHGARYYYAGGIHYKATFYQGRTCYMRVNF